MLHSPYNAEQPRYLAARLWTDPLGPSWANRPVLLEYLLWFTALEAAQSWYESHIKFRTTDS